MRHDHNAAAMIVFLGSAVFASMTETPLAIAIVSREFIYETAPFPSAHASTLVETADGLVAAWFGGTAEKHPDVAIWTSRRNLQGEGGWTLPSQSATGEQPDGRRFPTWNPVLFAIPNGPLVLFYKVGPSPREWWGMVTATDDVTAAVGNMAAKASFRGWQRPRRLPAGILGPIRAKPVLLDPNTLLAGSSTEDSGWRVHLETLTIRASAFATQHLAAEEFLARAESAESWARTPPLNTPQEFGAIQPTILVHSPARRQILCRTEQGVIAESWSNDGGATWSRLKATKLPNPSAGIDIVKLANGLFVLAYNPSAENRHRIALSTSRDGVAWSAPVTIEDGPGEYSYPAIIQTRDGLVHMTYTWRRARIRHVTLRIE
jgi:predicted neuraminidase